MKLLNTIIIGSSIILMASSCSNNSETKYANPCDELDAVDLEMLQKIDKIRGQYKDEPDFIKRLNDAQIYWIQYKDRHIRALYPDKKENYKKEFGMDYNYCKCDEHVRITKARIEELNRWSNPKKTHDKCPTSIK